MWFHPLFVFFKKKKQKHRETVKFSEGKRHVDVLDLSLFISSIDLLRVSALSAGQSWSERVHGSPTFADQRVNPNPRLLNTPSLWSQWNVEIPYLTMVSFGGV